MGSFDSTMRADAGKCCSAPPVGTPGGTPDMAEDESVPVRRRGVATVWLQSGRVVSGGNFHRARQVVQPTMGIASGQRRAGVPGEFLKCAQVDA